MLSLGVTAAQQAALVRALGASHAIRVQVLVTDADHRVVGDVSALLMDGQVDAKADEAGGWKQSRASTVSLWDPAHQLGFDTDKPHEGQIFADRMLQITYSVQVEAPPVTAPDTPPAPPPVMGPNSLGGWVDVPVFTGPVVAARRTGPTLTVECLGKEHLASASSYTPRTFRKGTTKWSVIRDLLAATGETPARMDLPRTTHRLPNDLVLAREDDLWERAIYLAQSMGMHLSYDARGIVRLARPGANVVFTFRDGSASTGAAPALVMSEPAPQFDTGDINNVVRVEGAPKAKGKPSNIAVAWAPAGHPLSPYVLGRGGQPRILMQTVEDQDIRTEQEATTLAEETLAMHLRKYVHVTLDTLPVPFLEPWDLCAVQARNVTVPTFRVTEFSLPLSHAGLMSVGARRQVSNKRRGRA